MKGKRNLFTLSPINESNPGSNVREAATATNTTMMAPKAMEINVKSLVNISPPKDNMTVPPA